MQSSDGHLVVGVVGVGQADRLALAVLPVAATLGDGRQPAVLDVERAQCVGVTDLDLGRQCHSSSSPSSVADVAPVDVAADGR